MGNENPKNSKVPLSLSENVRIAGGGELNELVAGKHSALTPNQGLEILDNQNFLKENPLRPLLSKDFIRREKITHFDNESIPERLVGVRGPGVHGYFELTHSLQEYTTAKILTEVSEKTPLFTLISTLARGSGSVDTPRDVRGFATK